MRCYLVRHGQAAPGPDDRGRPLTVDGRAAIAGLGEELAGRGVTVAEIGHSGLARARETAEILGRALAPPRGIRLVAGLGPDDLPEAARAFLLAAREPVMLVGHLPHLARLAALLVHGEAPAPEAVAFDPGTVACLVRGPDGRWAVGWTAPAAARREGGR